MKEQSRRQFINSCLSWAISGFGFSFISLCAGCNEEKKSTTLSGIVDRKKKELPVFEGTAKINPDFCYVYDFMRFFQLTSLL